MRWQRSTWMRRTALQSPGLRNTRWTKLKLGWWTFCIWSVFVCMSRMIDKFVLYRRFTSTTQQRWQKRSQPWWNCRTGSFVGPLPAWGPCFSWEYDFVEILIFFREKKKLQDELNQLSRNCLTDVQSRFWSSDQHAKILCNARDHFLFKVFWPKRHLPRWSPVALLAATEEALHLWRLQHCCHVIRALFFLIQTTFYFRQNHTTYEREEKLSEQKVKESSTERVAPLAIRDAFKNVLADFAR